MELNISKKYSNITVKVSPKFRDDLIVIAKERGVRLSDVVRERLGDTGAATAA